MKTHLTEEEVYDLAYDKLDVSNIKVDRVHALATMLDLEYDEKKEAYWNPDLCDSCKGSGYDKRKVCSDCDGSGSAVKKSLTKTL